MGIADLLTALKAAIKEEPADEWGPPEIPEDSPEHETEDAGEWDRPETREPKKRAPGVYRMNLPDRSDWISLIPYVLIQFLSSKDKYNKDERDRQSTADVRVLIATYCADGEDGGLQVLEIIERIRIHLQTGMLLDGNFMLQMPFDTEVYPDDTGNYFLGQIDMTWSIPVIERTECFIEDVRRKENE